MYRDTLYIQMHTKICRRYPSCWSGLSQCRRSLFMLQWTKEYF